MIWQSTGDFFAMGGYGLYVWGAYGLTLVLMLTEPLLATRRRRQALAAAQQALAANLAANLADKEDLQ